MPPVFAARPPKVPIPGIAPSVCELVAGAEEARLEVVVTAAKSGVKVSDSIAALLERALAIQSRATFPYSPVEKPRVMAFGRGKAKERT